MKITPIQIELENIFNRRERTILISFLNLDSPWHSTSLFEIGLWEGYFHLEILFWYFIYSKIRNWLEK